MKSLSEFESFYQTALLPKLHALEDERERVNQKRKKSLLYTIAIALVLPCILLFLVLSEKIEAESLASFWKLGIGYVFLCYGIYHWFFSKTLKAFARKFKIEVVGEMVKFVNEDLHFNPDGNIDEKTFNRSSIFTAEPTSYTSEDSVRGKIGETRIKFAEIDSSTGSGRNRKTLFKGLFFLADFNKKFNTRTVVIPDSYGKSFQKIGNFFQKMSISRDPLVKLEDPEFEHYFAVHSKDQVEARYILSPSLMARIVDFRKKTGIAISVSFRDNRIYLAVPLDKNLFEPTVKTSLVDPKPLAEYFQYVSLMVGIVEDLNLNNRIWTKN